jgi:uncharacterized protein
MPESEAHRAGPDSGPEEAQRTENKPQRRISRRGFLKLAGGAALDAAALGLAGSVYARDVEPGWVEVRHLRLSLPRLPERFAGYRIVQISDVHIDGATSPDYLSEVVRLIDRQQPDFIVATGDYVTSSPERFAPQLREFFGRLKARDGKAAVLGNHDHDAGSLAIERAIQESGTPCLDNRVLEVERRSGRLHICGVDDVWMGRPDLGSVLARLPDAGNSAAILLVHEPDFADIASRTGRFDLQLSGHSHGGQVRLPIVGAPRLPPYARRYPMGLYRVGGMPLYTNRGIGMLPPRVRFLCRPEITAFTLYPR